MEKFAHLPYDAMPGLQMPLDGVLWRILPSAPKKSLTKNFPAMKSHVSSFGIMVDEAKVWTLAQLEKLWQLHFPVIQLSWLHKAEVRLAPGCAQPVAAVPAAKEAPG